ncbi:MAG: hypothetical protein A2Y62_22310 [Candidatus Fischerbacteria bacterium RBG_13_37_8]|uniref:Uncharacterized protein n=1 Tax=Candidatus Fischerbacteria bacterium RBG_13_37_8 TaxID=1817863 RepID=A0A1F5VKM4_9BACT|nr:MAG: hypothetical protein A2Y62_22310 [Candidatus Fischerbacteria bacterium RBG_13_37_8]
MKTKLDELLSNYLRKDKNASKTLSASPLTAENIYKVEDAQSNQQVSDSAVFKSSKLKIWDLDPHKEKAPSVKKEKLEFPEFLEFALKENEKLKNKREGTKIGTIKKTEASKELPIENQKEHSISKSTRNKRQKKAPVPSEKTIVTEVQQKEEKIPEKAIIQEQKSHISTKKIKPISNNSKKTMTAKKSKTQKNVWVQKERSERQESIISLLSEIKQITLLDMCKKHHARIGIRWPESGKWNENPWKVIRNDCRELAKAKKIEMYKDERGKTYLRALDAKKILVQEKPLVAEPSIIPESATLFQRDVTVGASPLANTDLKKSIETLENHLEKLSDEIMEIWKTLAQLQIRRK